MESVSHNRRARHLGDPEAREPNVECLERLRPARHAVERKDRRLGVPCAGELEEEEPVEAEQEEVGIHAVARPAGGVDEEDEHQVLQGATTQQEQLQQRQR